jgi:DNA-binding IclR family transcriptional regulator
MNVLALIAESNQSLNMAEIRKALNLPKSTASDILNSLVELGILNFNPDDGNSLTLGEAFFWLSAKFVNNNGLLSIARGCMQPLAEKIGLSVFLSVFRNGKMTFLEKTDADNALQPNYLSGSVSPLHASACGKAFLAIHDFPDIKSLVGCEPFERFTKNTLVSYGELLIDIEAARERKYSIENMERTDQIVGVAAPIRQADSSGIAAISVLGLCQHMPDDRMAVIGSEISMAALRISKRLGFVGNNVLASFDGAHDKHTLRL